MKLYDNHLSARQAVENVTSGTRRRSRRRRDRRHRGSTPPGRSPTGTTSRSTSPTTAARAWWMRETRPNVFRIAPTNRGIAFRLAEYLIPKRLKVALVQRRQRLRKAGRGRRRARVLGEPGVGCDQADRCPPGDGSLAADPAPAPRPARRPCSSGASRRRSRPCSRPPAPSAGTCPSSPTPTGADPVRASAARGPPGLGRRAHVRLGSHDRRGGPAPFLNFQSQYESTYGVDRVGVRTRPVKPVFQPPEFAIVLERLRPRSRRRDHAGGLGRGPRRSSRALNEVTTQGANGDERGFNEQQPRGRRRLTTSTSLASRTWSTARCTTTRSRRRSRRSRRPRPGEPAPQRVSGRSGGDGHCDCSRVFPSWLPRAQRWTRCCCPARRPTPLPSPPLAAVECRADEAPAVHDPRAASRSVHAGVGPDGEIVPARCTD